MDGNVKELETREYLKLCQKHWRWILDNYDRLVYEGDLVNIRGLKGAYFDEYGLDEPTSGCYLCELTNTKCLKCPLSGIAWKKDNDFPCVNDKSSVYRRITDLVREKLYEEAKDAIKEFLLMIDKECRHW